jgi:glyoxylase-like metal-dependent hydrolase (beta-lactamase superfamily II)
MKLQNNQRKIILDSIILPALLTFMVAGLISCNSIVTSRENYADQLTDSLIRKERLADQTILISFGGEAITAIETKKGIVVVDAGIGSGLTSRYRKLIEKEFNRNDFTTLILTHGHHDHYGGSGIFSDATIVAHENCIKAITNRWKEPDKVKANLLKIINEYDRAMDTLDKKSAEWIDNYELETRFQSAYDDIMNNRPAEMPDITFSDTLTLDMGDRTFHMIWFGEAHSDSDILIHVPELKILFTGDLFFKYGRPSMDDTMKIDPLRFAVVSEWINARREQIQIIVGGHGQILSKEDLLSFCRKINPPVEFR